MHERMMIGTENIISFENYSDLNHIYPPNLYKKLSSILLLKSIGLPILPGFVISRLDDNTINILSGWADKTGSSRLSLRFDSPKVEDHIRLSSLNPSIPDLKKVASVITPPVIGLVLAENDRYKQGHSVLMQFLEDSMRLDIVGPGFDAGDITRGNVSPHETLEIDLRSPEACQDKLNPLDILNHTFITQGCYAESRDLRYGVIYSTINKGLGKSVLPQKLNAEQKQKANEFLLTRGAVIPDNYQPLGWGNLSKIYSFVAPLLFFREYYKNNFGVDVRQKVLSASFLVKHGLVFWDFYDGKKYRQK